MLGNGYKRSGDEFKLDQYSSKLQLWIISKNSFSFVLKNIKKVLTSMDFFTELNKTAAECLQYIPFDKLTPGRYNVKEFFIKEDCTFNTGERICINFNDEFYVMLPKRFTTRKYPMAKMNSKPTDFIFRGKQSKFVVDFNFAPADLTKCSEIHINGPNEQSSDEE